MAVEQTFGLVPSTFQVFEARFGDKGGALALLEYPQQMREFFLRLSDKADLPDSAPPGATWEPFVRGWPQDGYYIIALTKADHAAARPGMIATRMIAVPIKDAGQLHDLSTLFEILQMNRAYAPEFALPLRNGNDQQDVSSTLLASVATHLIQEDKPAAIIGQKGFEALIAALWLKLPPELRRIFGFGFSFTPTDLTVTRANIVAVPESCEARWSGYKFKCDQNGGQPLSEPAAAFLSNPQADAFLKFLKDTGLIFHSFSDYGRYARLWNYWQRRDTKDPEVSNALLRSLGTLLPNPSQAANQKEEAMQIVAAQIKDVTHEGILALRSVKTSSFPSNAVVLESAVCGWIKSRIHTNSAANRDELTKVILALPSSQSADWQQWVRKGLRQEFAFLSQNAAQTIWSVWKDETTFGEIAALLPENAPTENELVRTFPSSITTKMYSLLERWCLNRNWICLMARAALSQVGFRKAMDLVFEQHQVNKITGAIELLCASAEPAEIWTSAFAHDDPALVKCAVKAARAEPSLWTAENENVGRWIALLESAARADFAILNKISTRAVVLRIYEAWGKGIPVTEPICEMLEKAGCLEFTGLINRNQIWRKLPRRFLNNSLNNTIRAWLNDYYSSLPAKPELEKELVAILFDAENINFTFPRNHKELGVGGLILVESWGAQQHCRSWLNAVVASSIMLDSKVGQRAGDLITKRDWMSVAKAAKEYDERRGRQDLRIIWETYYDSLGRLEKLAFNYWPGTVRHSSNFDEVTDPEVRIDAVFVTALPEEFSAVRSHLEERQEHTEQGTIYEVGRFRTIEATCTVAIVQTGMGNSPSAAATERALNLFKPHFAFFVGIAGGLRQDLKIGDVVVANKVYGYEAGKSGVGFQPRPDAPPVSHEAEQRAYAVVRDKLWQKRINPVPNTIPDAIVRPIAAGEKVLISESSEDLKRVRATYTDAYAVAMEDHGFATAVRGHPNVCFAVVRSISDLIENKRETDSAGSHDIAARNAAAFAFEMLAGLLSRLLKNPENL